MTNVSYDEVKAPGFALMALESWRTMGELSLLPASTPLLKMAPRGDGYPVLVCPGFLAGDATTTVLRKFLSSKDYDVYGWNLGQNLGMKTTGDDGELLADRVMEIYKKSRQKISLVGWSLGGVMAREIAKKLPDQVRQVITLGSPIVGRPDTSNISWLYQKVSGHSLTRSELIELQEELKDPPADIPSTSIYSKTDGIVAWKTCKEPKSTLTDNIEVFASHCGLGVNAGVFYAIADRLALPEDEWSPFDRMTPFWRRAIYPSSGH